MEIKPTYDNLYFDKFSRALGNCYIVTDKNQKYYYEFLITDHIATIKTESLLYLEEVSREHHKTHPTISIYKGKDFYMEMDKVFTFKLPISILQVSKFFLNQDYIKELQAIPSFDTLQIPVQIIDEEYVVIDNHHLLYMAKELDYKMVEVYIAEPKEHTLDFLYLAKEQNIKTIHDVKCLPKDTYQKVEQDLKMIFSVYN